MSEPVSRREFLRLSGTGGLGGAALFVSRLPAIQAVALAACRAAEEKRPFRNLTPDAAQEIEAVAAQIFPSDGTPGAREANIIHFIDQSLGSFAAATKESLVTGLRELSDAVRKRYPRARAFSELSGEEQKAVLGDIEEGEFFGSVRFLTVLGMFSNPKYGGNRDGTGWRILGFEDRGAWQPPFGWYDARYAASEEIAARDGQRAVPPITTGTGELEAGGP